MGGGNESLGENTHVVENQPPPLEDYDAFEGDRALVEALRREGGDWGVERCRVLGAKVGSARVQELGHLANRYVPELHSHDRFGHRIDEVRFHPAWHELMALGIGAAAHALPWRESRAGAHVVRAALCFLLNQAESGICCPVAMAFAAVPTLRAEPQVAAEWEPRVLSEAYDARVLPAERKAGALIGMAMTEKQGGSDVRANTTRARPLDRRAGIYALTGHKWFCSAPMSDAFLTLAQAEKGPTCFLVPRWLPDGRRNRLLVQRLKDKLGNRSNASAEIEYAETWARRVGPEGEGVRTIISMVDHTRLDVAVGSAALMRRAVAEAVHHAAYRSAFGRRLAEQPLMRSVLADLAVESEAATVTAMRLARAFDDSAEGPERDPFLRVALPVAKFWIAKRAPAVVGEALECLGGNGYVEESIAPRLYREAPVNGVWEGAGNVICLDALRAMQRLPAALPAFLEELAAAKGADDRLDRHLAALEADLAGGVPDEGQARVLMRRLALAWQAGLLLRHAPAAVAEAFCAARLAGVGSVFGDVPHGLDTEAILERARATRARSGDAPRPDAERRRQPA